MQRVWPSLLALAGTVAVVLGLLALTGGEVEDSTPDDVTADAGVDAAPEDPAATEPPPGTPSTPPAPSTPPEQQGPVIAPPEVREPVGVLNQTSIGGLAAKAQERLQAGGWEVPATGDFVGTVPETTVYYPEGMQAAAEALSAQFPEIGRVQPSFEGLTQSRLVLILVEDYDTEIAESP
ncbi:MAG: LytR C-terminal domain-containing protein [Jiangellaceae bacterium]